MTTARAEILDAFCVPDDPIYSASASASASEPAARDWSLRLRAPLKPALLCRDPGFAEWRVNARTYGRAAAPGDARFSSAVRTLVGVHPRFPALLLDPGGTAEGDKRVLGEAALDSDSLPGGGVAGGAGGPLLDAVGVFCLPLRDQVDAGLGGGQGDGHVVCLLLVPQRPGSTSYVRVGLGFVQDTGWFGEEGDGYDGQPVDCEIV